MSCERPDARPRRPRPPAAILAAAIAALASLPAVADGPAGAGREGIAAPPGQPRVDPASGIAGVVFPIEVPPGRHGLQPQMALRYLSAAGPGNAGHGFTLDLGSIERSTRYGPPRFDNSDVFVMTLDGESHELFALDPSSTQFRTVIDTGFLIARLSPGPFGPGSTYWVARGRDGRAYRFGFNGDAASGNVSQVANFKWGLDRVEDTPGNVMAIRYLAQGARLYPIRIDYAAHPATGLPATNAVQLCWERRGDESPTPYGERFLYRLSSILTTASGQVARSFAFRYDMPGSTTDIIGSCAPGPAAAPIDGGGPTGPGSPGGPGGGPPKINAAVWSAPGPGRPPSTATTLPPMGGVTTALPAGESSLVGIVRGDGAGGTLPAIEYSYYFGDGYGHWPAALPGGAPPLPLVYGSFGEDEDPGVRLEDLNRDGLPDLVQFAAHLTGGVYQVSAAVYLNTGAGFVYDAAWTASLTNLIDTADQSRSAYFVLKRDTLNRVEMGVRFLDVNDDGYPDVVRIAQHYNLGIRKGVFLNTGSGFTTDRSATYPLPDEPFVWVHAESGRDLSDDLGVRLADVNADGRADILVSRAEWGAPATRRVYLYDRGLYRLDPGWILPDEPFVRHVSHGRYLDMGLRLMELNGDGLVDLFRASNVDGTVQNVAYLNTGRPGGSSPTWAPGGSGWFLEIAGAERFVDVSSAGDGASLDRGLRVVNETRLQTSYIILARSWNGVQQKTAYYPVPTGGWGRVDFSWFPGLFVVKAPGGAPRDQGVRLIDLDGDGGADYLAAPEAGTREWRGNTSWLPGSLMKSYTNGLGGRTSMVYSPAPHTGLAEGGTRAALPYPVAVVTERSDEDGMGHTYATRYAYEGPFHNHAGRDFRGFRKVTVTGPGGSQSVETLFYQQPALRAAPLRGVPQERVVRRAADGAVFTRTAWTHDTGDVIPPLAHPLVRDETTLYDWTTTDAGSAAYVRRSAVSYAYLFDETSHAPDRMMLRRTERREGSVDDPLDDRVIT
ncbi:MAG TPA: toxin TcdB middle/N-terminal domain-containing protein, partial [Candidatus Dormibacteraeota bacterium]|nr:toxin TcdB middle/N-terminal domain-containing protein [Candidatus Dormibacteraeota bacterium]